MTNNKKMSIVLSTVIALLIIEIVLSVVCICELKLANDEIQSVVLSETYLEMDVGDKIVLQTQIEGNVTNKIRKWTSSNEQVATVDRSSGEVTAVSFGAATITFSVGKKSAFCSVYVKQPQAEIPPDDVEVDGIILNANSVELALNESYTLTADISPENATDKTVTWKSSDTSVATVDDGVVTAVGNGVALLYATAGSKIAVCTVKVEEDNSERELRFKTLDVQNYVVSGVVPNSRDEFSFAEEIYTDFGKPVYAVCTDIECRNDIPSKIASLKVGDNKFYILTAINGEPQVYRVTIHRLELFTVSFDTDGGTPINPITAEEGTVVTLPEAVKAGYVFNYWTLNGNALVKTLTVTENVELHAEYVEIKYVLTLKSDGCDAELTGGGAYFKNERVTVSAESRLGYEFLGWYDGKTKMSDEYSFSLLMPILPVMLTAKYKVSDEVANLDFVSTADTFVINGFKNLSDTAVLTVPEYTTDIEDDAFSSFGDRIIIDQVYWKASLPFDKEAELFRDTLIRNFNLRKGITSFPKWTFLDCYGIENLRYQGTIADWCDMQFGDALYYHCSPLAYSINFYADGEQITEVIIPQNVKTINDFLFFGAAQITRVVLPDGLLKIGESAFSNCKKLRECNIPQSVTEIGTAAFAHTAISGQVVIPSGVKTLENNIFDNGSVSSVVIPSSVTSIGAYVFRKAPLEAVYYCGTAEQWNAIAISATNVELNNATLYCYSEADPPLNADGTDYDGNYWRYVDGVVTVWRKEKI